MDISALGFDNADSALAVAEKNEDGIFFDFGGVNELTLLPVDAASPGESDFALIA